MRIPAALIVAAALVAGPSAAPALASEGSVPTEVAAFVTAPDGLIAGLDDFFGVGSDGKGFDFDETTTFGAVDRVFSFTPEWLAGTKTDTPVIIANEWTVPVLIAEKAVGIAVIWINPGTVRPQLADFLPDARLAAALTEVPDGTWVVHDEPRSAWLLLTPPALVPLVGGTSGFTGETTLTVYQNVLGMTSPTPDPGPNLGSALSVGIIVAVSLVVILVLLVPLARRRRREVDAD